MKGVMEGKERATCYCLGLWDREIWGLFEREGSRRVKVVDVRGVVIVCLEIALVEAALRRDAWITGNGRKGLLRGK